jgi:glycosyltransferase involved in cell wall biosynthesis
MKLGLVLPVFNRPDQLRECLKSVSESIFPSETVLILINDGSTDPETENLWKGFNLEGVQIIRLIQPNKGIRDTLQIGWDMCIAMGCDVLTNLDSDAIVKPDVWGQAFDKTHRLS